MSEVVVVAEIKTDPERRDEALAALERLCEETHANDDGCILYSLQIDPGDDGRFFMVEKWSSAEALQTHGETDHIKAFVASGVLAGDIDVAVLQQANFGDPGKGSL